MCELGPNNRNGGTGANNRNGGTAANNSNGGTPPVPGIIFWEMQIPQTGNVWVPLAAAEFPYSASSIAGIPVRVTNLSGAAINVPAGSGTITAPASPYGDPAANIGAIGAVADGETKQTVFGADGGEQSLTGPYIFAGNIPGFVTLNFTQNFTYDA